MRRFLALVLLALLPLQFSWAAVASYCAHEAQAGAGHFGHHDHEHHHGHPAEAGDTAGLDSSLDAGPATATSADAGDGQTPGAVDLDCGHCHGSCSMLLNLPAPVPAALSSAPPRAATDESGAALAPTRPERPQWRPLA